jgi:hypothetical protein
MANHSLFPRNKFAKRHYEAIAQAMQEAIQGSTSSTMASFTNSSPLSVPVPISDKSRKLLLIINDAHYVVRAHPQSFSGWPSNQKLRQTKSLALAHLVIDGCAR